MKINQYNANGKAHGFWRISNNGCQLFKGWYNNGSSIGYWEEYHYNGKLKRKEYYI